VASELEEVTGEALAALILLEEPWQVVLMFAQNIHGATKADDGGLAHLFVHEGH
jgi:hypothetical protein